MRFYWQMAVLIWRKLVLRRNTGEIVGQFAEKMGVVYIKLAQMLAMQNYGDVFTETDREKLSKICDECNPIPYAEVRKMLEVEYGARLTEIFDEIGEVPVGSASVSQVHWARLKTGEEVAIKVKRRDVAKTIEKDLKLIKKTMYRFGWLIKFKNYTGGERSLELYLKWIRQETDFRHEQKNIETYREFAENVSGRIPNTGRIRVPKLYKEYCTENVIVMEFVRDLTINKMDLTAENKKLISKALNNYIRLSFWALLHDEPVVFHGDPHSGNVCVDGEGNICFLDMGLLCVMSDEEAKLCRKFFLAAYAGNYDKLYDFLVGYGEMEDKVRESFREDCQKFCDGVRGKNITYYFMDMMNICLKYEFVPPDFLFNMAKAFVCLNGMSNFVENDLAAVKLLQEQVVEFMARRSLRDCGRVVKSGLEMVPEFWSGVVRDGWSKATVRLISNNRMKKEVKTSLDNLSEMMDLMKMSNRV